MTDKLVERKLYQTITSSSEPDLDTSGGKAWSGKLLSARLIRSRTSFEAASISRASVNSMEILERPLREDEEIFLIPSMPLIRSSNNCVMRVSIIAADAPG